MLPDNDHFYIGDEDYKCAFQLGEHYDNSLLCNILGNTLSVFKLYYQSRRIRYGDGNSRETEIHLHVCSYSTCPLHFNREANIYVQKGGQLHPLRIKVNLSSNTLSRSSGSDEFIISFSYNELAPTTLISVETVLKSLIREAGGYLRHNLDKFYDRWKGRLSDVVVNNHYSSPGYVESDRFKSAYSMGIDPVDHIGLLKPTNVGVGGLDKSDSSDKLSKTKAIINGLAKPKKVQISVKSKKSKLWLNK